MALQSFYNKSGTVTPRAGVWVEIECYVPAVPGRCVTPRAGVWVEIGHKDKKGNLIYNVTPRAGVWVEMQNWFNMPAQHMCHSPCGSVG